MITLIKYLFLAIIQGLTEPIPVSSSGHLIIFRNLINMKELNDLNFEILLKRINVLQLLQDFFDILLYISNSSLSGFIYGLFFDS